jgi:hypothetical protein
MTVGLGDGAWHPPQPQSNPRASAGDEMVGVTGLSEDPFTAFAVVPLILIPGSHDISDTVLPPRIDQSNGS